MNPNYKFSGGVRQRIMEQEKSNKLRKRAEALLNKEDDPGIQAEDTFKLIHELRTHQIELELQNEDLCMAQSELEASRQKYIELYDFAPVGYFTTDLKGLILEVNLAGADLFGIERKYLAQRLFVSFVAPEFTDTFFSHRKQAMNTRTSQTCELQLIKNDKTPFYAILKTIAMAGTDGEFSRIQTAVTDISERREAERVLQKAHDQLEQRVRDRTAELAALNKQLSQEIEDRKRIEQVVKKSEIRLNEAQTIAHVGSYERRFPSGEGYWSDEYYRILGYEPGEVPCSYDIFKKHIHPDDQDGITAQLEEILANNASCAFQFRFFRKDGELRHGYALGIARQDKTGNSVISGTLQDITDRVVMETELHEKQAQLAHAGRLSSLGEMAAGMAHELNQPLYLILGNTEHLQLLLKKQDNLQPKFDKILKSTMKSVERASRIIEHMREFARAKPADRGCQNEISLTEPVENSLAFFREQFRHHIILLETYYEENLPKISADPGGLEQVMVNFLSNARYAVDKQEEQERGDYHKKIVISVYHDKIENYVVAEITDNGIGMTPEEKDRCMEPFFTTKEIGQGTGLGLSIVYGIVEESDGKIEIKSEKGRGTTMRLKFEIT